ncbi:AsmA family protein [Bordetella sp. FB-8]|uniref:AsmA family protein n=1 Tax=Bordetella sp. FB-8 TaxID=1159870 RepID=UPI00037F146A|nr:AsmA family protein [Bordetella sp. FB-8]
MTRKKKIALHALALLLALPAVLAIVVGVVVSKLDMNRFKPRIDAEVSAALGRPFAIQGDLSVTWGRGAPADSGWRGLLPWPHVIAQDLTLGNAAWARTPIMASLKRVQFAISPLPLLVHRVVIRDLQLTDPSLDLQRLADGRANWDLTLPASAGAAGASSSWSVDIDKIGFDQGTVAFTDDTLKADVSLKINPLGKPIPFADIVGMQPDASQASVAAQPEAVAKSAQASDDLEADTALDQAEKAGKAYAQNASDYIFGWKAAGRYRGLPFKGEGKIGGMLALQNPKLPFPIQAKVEVGRTRASIVGTLIDPKNLGALNLRLSLSGASMADLFPLTGVALPDTPAYSTDGRLVANLRDKAGPVFSYRDFDGRVGQSDLHGTLRFTLRSPRPRLVGQVWSNQLRMVDLGPLIGIGAKDGDTPPPNAAAAAARAAAGKVLPAAAFRTDRWRDMDADVTFFGQRIQHSGRLPLSDLNTHVVLQDGKLTMDPLRFGIAGGTIAGAVRLDGSRTPMLGRLRVSAQALQLKQLFPDMHAPQAQGMLGQLRGNAILSGKGNSVAALLGDANGEVHALVNDGVVSRGLMELAGLNVGNYLMAKLFGDDDVKINCAAADLGMNKGIMKTRALMFDTENALVNVNGTANFRDETLNLTVSPESKGFRIFSLRSPLYVRGTFAKPDTGVEVGPLLARGAGLVALSVALTPAAGLLALIATPSSDAHAQSACAKLLTEARGPVRLPAKK